VLPAFEMETMGARENTAATDERVPRLGPGVDPTALPLTPVEGFLLSRVDGRTPWHVLRVMGGLAPDDVDRHLERWLADGVLVVDGAPGAAGAAAGGTPLAAPPPGPPAPPPGVSLPEVDPTLQLPVGVQRTVLDLALRLDAPYHEILGVDPEADRKALKRAYFALSKRLHPDRYFRKELGAFGPQLQRVYKKIVEAYELLSDPMARAEIARSLAAATPAGAGAEQVAAEAPPAAQAPPAAETPPAAAGSARPTAPRRPHVFAMATRVLRERRKRAKRFFEAGMAAFANERWLEAAGSVRLAIAFDPWNAIYKEQFAEVQQRAHAERAKQLVKDADSALELRDYAAALRAFEEALNYRPGDLELLRRGARLALHTGNDLHRAKEWATEAVELAPRDAGAHRLLGQIYKAAGLEANARRELETAVNLDPKDDEARTELRALGGGTRSALRWLGGRR
jgi:curved DNA-binding protein CbpA